VAETKTTPDKIGLTRGKAVLVGALGVTLVGVLYVQFAGSETGNLPTLKSSTRLEPLTRSMSHRSSAMPDEKSDQQLQAVLAELSHTRWKTPPLAEVLAHDPFALPASFPQPPQALRPTDLSHDGADTSPAAANARQLADAVERMGRQLEELQQRGVHVIVNERDQYVAMIGDRTVYVGDEINGFTVTAIEPDGVRVEMKGGP
jgi:hypothetical protein